MTVLTIDQALTKAESHKSRGELEDAKRLLEAVLQAFPKHVQARKDLASLKVLSEQGDPPKHVIDRLLNVYKAGQLSSVVEEAQALVKDFPEAFLIWNILGAAAAQLGMLEQARSAFQKVISLKPNYADAYNNLGNVLNELGEQEQAILSYQRAIDIKPDYAEAYNNLGNAFSDQNKLDEAIAANKKAIEINPDYVEAHHNLGTALRASGLLDEALAAFDQALKIKPDFIDSHNNLGGVLKDLDRYRKAIASYERAIEIQPDYASAHRNLSFVLLNSGKIKEGLDEYEWRWKTPKYIEGMRHFSQPLWDGKDSLKGKRILLWNEQGVGETINWSSYIPLIASQADHCILECQEKVIPLLSRSFPNITIQPENRMSDASRDDFDFHIPMGSLYRQLFSKISQQSTTNAFLIPNPDRVNYWKERLQSLGDGPYVGIGWKSSIVSSNSMPNYASISEWAPLLTLPGVTFVNLQYRDYEADLDKIRDDFGVTIHNFEDLDLFDDIDDVAALCSALDIVVSTTSAVPIISAGVGTLTKLARWKQSSWNNPLFQPRGPELDIFYRNTWETWDSVFQAIANDIGKVIRSNSYSELV